jgi:transposase
MKRRYEAVAPEVQRAIAAEYQPSVRGSGRRALASKYGLIVGTVQHVLERAERGGGDPVTPRGHRKRKLDATDESKLERALDQDPLATNRELATVVADAIAPRTVSTYLNRANPPFTTKVVQDQEPEELTEDWKAKARRWLGKVKNIPLDRRIYADETAVYANEAPRKGRSRKGKPIFRPRSRWAKRYTLHVFAKRAGVVHWELSAHNGDTKEIERVAAAAAPKMERGDVLIWDQLGRSGRSVNPVAQHYSPVAREQFAAHGVKVEYLPPKGKYFNPAELLFNDLKSHYIRPEFPGSGEKLTLDKIHALVKGYMDEKAAIALPGFFAQRANGKYALMKKLI